MAGPAQQILMVLVFPLWVAAGFTDWLCHRRTGIERTSGLKESLMHLLMLAEIGAAMLVVALFEINAAVLLCVAVAFVVHELTVYWDLHYTTPLRRVGPFEQMVHSFLELLPLVSLALLTVMGWDQLLDFNLQRKAQPWPTAYLACAFAAAVLFNGLPLLEETWRCWRFRARTRPSPAPR
ncbi:MAG: diguanylate cyclase [Burkholderiales bacterium]|nr:diguanylate cyclase [Burkholderiales bacterium]